MGNVKKVLIFSFIISLNAQALTLSGLSGSSLGSSSLSS